MHRPRASLFPIIFGFVHVKSPVQPTKHALLWFASMRGGGKGVFGCCHSCCRAASKTDKTVAQRLLARCGTRFALPAAARAKTAPNCGGDIWLPHRAAHYGQNGHPTIIGMLRRAICTTGCGTRQNCSKLRQRHLAPAVFRMCGAAACGVVWKPS